MRDRLFQEDDRLLLVAGMLAQALAHLLAMWFLFALTLCLLFPSSALPASTPSEGQRDDDSD